MASARRRRTGTDQQTQQSQSSSTNNRSIQQNKLSEENENNGSMTPLQILQHHDSKLRDLELLINENNDNNDNNLESLVEEKVNSLLKVKLDSYNHELEKIKGLMNNKNNDSGSYTNIVNPVTNYDSLINDKLSNIEKTFESKLEIQNVKIEEFKNGSHETFSIFKEDNSKIVNLLNTNIENYITSKIASLNDTLKPTLEKLNSLNTIYENYKVSVEKIDDIIKEFNTLKLLVIKNQTIALETTSDMIKIKEEFKLNNDKINQVNNKVNALDDRTKDDNNNDPSHMLLKSLMSSNLFNTMNNENNMDYDSDSIRDDGEKLHIDENNDEIVMDESQLDEILDIDNMDNLNLESLNKEEITETEMSKTLQESLKQEVIEEISIVSDNTETTLNDIDESLNKNTEQEIVNNN